MHPHWRKKKKKRASSYLMQLWACAPPEGSQYLLKFLLKKKMKKKMEKKKKREKTKSNFLVLCLLLNWHSSKDQLEPTELAMIKEPIHTCARTHTQTKNRLHSGRTRPTTIWNELLTQKELLLGRDIAVPFNQYCQNRCLYQRLLFILHQDRNSTWWSLGRKYNVANCFSRSEESRFMVEIAPKMHCNIT